MSAPAGQQGGIVAVGYGGSEAAQLAVRWAADYAAATGLDLRVVHAWVWPVFTKNLGPVKGVAGSGLRHSAEAILAEGVELARGAALRSSRRRSRRGGQRAVTGQEPERPGPAVDGVMEAGLPAPVLRDAARDARLLVVGSRGLGAVLGQVAGSVCLDLAGSAPCPVMVIRRPRSPRPHPVVVGVDASPRSPATLAEAVRLAEVLGAPLHLVHVDPLAAGHGKSTAAMPCSTARSCWTAPSTRPGAGARAGGYRRPARGPCGRPGAPRRRGRRRRPGAWDPQPCGRARATRSPPCCTRRAATCWSRR